MLALGETGVHDMEQDMVDLSSRQQDFFLISLKTNKIAILNLTRTLDMLITQLEEAYSKKKLKNTRLSYLLCNTTSTKVGA